MIPNLFIVGAPKCGTTAWVDYLKDHPEIFFSAIKEPFHFCDDWPDAWRMTDRAEYLRLFEGAGDAKAIGEASVWYLNSEVAAQNIRQFNPQAKIIIFVREQEKMLPSWHNQIVYAGRENILDFEQAWELSGERDASNLPPRSEMPRLLDYKAAGRFSEQIERFREAFPPEQVRIFH